MNERENILARLREALRVKAPVPGGHAGVAPGPASEHPRSQARRWLPAVAGTAAEQLAQFRANAAELKAQFRLLERREELPAALAELCQAEGWKRIATHRGELTDFACANLPAPACRTDGGYAVGELETCDAGITECDALIAQTGSVLITSRSAGGRALSVLPPHHVVLARRDQLLPDLPAAFALVRAKYAPNYPSLISLVTGPSRTGDIERILVLGAHGPKKLTILCC